MRRFVTLLVALALVCPTVANAQGRRDRDRDRDRGGRNDRGDRIVRVIRDCEDRTNDFRRAVERSRGRDDRRGGGDLERSAARLEQSLNRIRDSWNRDRDYDRTRRSVGAAIDAGRDINRILRRDRGSRVDREWGAIKSELNNLAEVFEQPRIRW